MATIRDVARKAGVSVGTVSSVINKNKYVSPALQQRVEAAIDALDYKPSPAAQALRSRRTRSLAFIVPDVTNPGFSRALRAMTRLARENGYTVLVLNTNGDPKASEECIHHVIGLRVDGVLLALTWDLAQPKLVDLLQKQNIQVVGLSGSRNLDGIDCFIWDETDAGYRLARYLVRLGHREIAFLGPPESQSANAKRRLQGVETALEKSRQSRTPVYIFETKGYSAKAAYECTLEAISSAAPFTALITFNDTFTTGALAALVDQGFMVPEHMSVATFGNSHTTFSRPQITSMTYDEDTVGTRASQRLLDRVRGVYTKGPRTELSPLNLVVRTSCRAVPSINLPGTR